MKFGGSSVKDEAAIGRVMAIVRKHLDEKPVVIVSALAAVTRQLLALAEAARSGDSETAEKILNYLEIRHIDLAAQLSSGSLLQDVRENIIRVMSGLYSDVSACICGSWTSTPEAFQAAIISHGELLSSMVINAAMNCAGIPCKLLDARKMVITDDNFLSAAVDMDKTCANISEAVGQAFDEAQVVLSQGFIATSRSGKPTVLGFEGSDYTAAIFGLATGADAVDIWTDVDGVRSADPRIVEGTVCVPSLSYEEASDMALLGARVLHPLTIRPARMKDIPINVRNTSNPDGEFSTVCDRHLVPGPKVVALLKGKDVSEMGVGEFEDLHCRPGETVVSIIGIGCGSDARVADAVRAAGYKAMVRPDSVSAIVPDDAAVSVARAFHKAICK